MLNTRLPTVNVPDGIESIKHRGWLPVRYTWNEARQRHGSKISKILIGVSCDLTAAFRSDDFSLTKVYAAELTFTIFVDQLIVQGLGLQQLLQDRQDLP